MYMFNARYYGINNFQCKIADDLHVLLLCGLPSMERQAVKQSNQNLEQGQVLQLCAVCPESSHQCRTCVAMKWPSWLLDSFHQTQSIPNQRKFS